MKKCDSYKHHFLIAMPSLKDSNFNKSVIYLYEHNDNGAMGLIINKPLKITLGNVMQHLKIKLTHTEIADSPVVLGGPVQPEQGFVIYPATENTKQKDSLEVIISNSKETLESIAHGKGPNHFLITLGYSGWGAGQLETEILRNDWLIAPFDPKILFNEPLGRRWMTAAKLLGIDIHRLSNQFGHA